MTEYRDDIEEIEEDEEVEGGFGQWLQDNLRIMISVIIVLLLALGIYSYSKRSQEPAVQTAYEPTPTEVAAVVATDDMTDTEAEATTEPVTPEATPEADTVATDDVAVATDTDVDANADADAQTPSDSETTENTEMDAADKDAAEEMTDTEEEDTKDGPIARMWQKVTGQADKVTEGAADAAAAVTDAAGSVIAQDAADNMDATPEKTDGAAHTAMRMATEDKEVEDAFVMAAHNGDGRTHLARRAVAGYLAKNSVDGITGAHKVYIEDYLQKNLNVPAHLMGGQEVRISKDLIKQAVERAQGLTDAQVRNLEKYARAAGLS